MGPSNHNLFQNKPKNFIISNTNQLQVTYYDNISEKESFDILKLWNMKQTFSKPSELLEKNDSFFKLFEHLYHKTEQLYDKMPKRKNGDSSFLHPLNAIWALKDAKIKNSKILCCALIHDLVEEMVDIHKKEANQTNIKILDEFENQTFKDLNQELSQFCKNHNIGQEHVDEIIETTRLLTRHKRDFYLKSMSYIFTYPNQKIKEMAIIVKLADRTHNILTLDSFDNQRKIYACFKNLFILNNVKDYIIKKHGNHMATSTTDFFPIELLFKRCAKATYQAFLEICNHTSISSTYNIKTMLQLAFKKFAIEQEGASKVTKLDSNEMHLMRLYQNVVRKYEARLHHEWDQFEQFINDEITFTNKFFYTQDFTNQELKSIISYKDAYSLKEIIANLLYIPDYVIERFLCFDLTKTGRLRK